MNALNCENNIFVYPIISQAWKSKSKLSLYIEQLYTSLKNEHSFYWMDENFELMTMELDYQTDE